ncbi:MAG TPA: ABC transporter ATP-binding protein [Oscillospiraceae bacterium]|nr:ABC transporter ATP-binding protein [Oscillospiraceae bacterium]
MIELKNLYKTYDRKTDVVKNLNLVIQDGELVVLIGESGCGKTTTMQMINRLIEPTGGSILINGKDTKTIDKNTLRRNIGYVIQDIGLFPHRTIEQNIATVPLLCRKDRAQVTEQVRALMETVGLPYDQYAARYPNELSGGQQQRVGVARALANDPDIILMDEPFSALDPITREQLQDELLRLHDEMGKTIVFVTHDMDEAIKLGDKIAIMQNGEIAQFDTPEELLKNPVSEFVAAFIGQNRLWKTPDLLKAEDVMAKDIVMVDANRTAIQAIEIMKKRNAPVLAVVEKTASGPDRLLGLVGINRLHSVLDSAAKVKDIMKTDIIKIPRDMSLTEVIALRGQNNVLFSPVVNGSDELVGIITNTSIVNVLSQIMPGKEDY